MSAMYRNPGTIGSTILGSHRSAVCGSLWVAVAVGVLACAIAPAAAMLPAAMVQPAPVIGDVNMNGHLDRRDFSAFVEAVRSAARWQQRHGRPLRDLVAVADFNEDEEVTAADARGFCAAFRVYLRSVQLGAGRAVWRNEPFVRSGHRFGQ